MGDHDRCRCPCHDDAHGHDHHHEHGHGHHRHHHHDDRRGPQDAAFLDLEISRVLEARAADLARPAAEELLREAIVERLRERMGARLREIGRAAADQLADDVEANLEIEARIVARRDARAGKPAPGREAAAVTRPDASPKGSARASRRRR